MRINRLDCWSEEFRLAEPYTIAYETVDKCENVFIRMETDNNIVAVGCAAPDRHITGEEAGAVLHHFHSVIKPLLYRADPFRYIHILETLKVELNGAKATIAMVDMMLYDLLAKSANIPLYKLLGGYRESIPTSITIGIMPLEDAFRKINDWIKNGFRIFKIKGGLNIDEDIERIIKIREKYGDNISIRFDANQGYSVSDAVKFISSTKNANVELFEQPTPRDKFSWLGIVTKKTDVPVIADESLMNLKDAFRITKLDLTDIINIKIMKVGGITEAMHINSTAKAAGIEAMVGCLDECSLGISAGLHFALARPNVSYADLDGHLTIIDDPTAGTVIIRDGILYPNHQPGLGFTF